ncbi:unnamed protein product, partial [Amoebophrya sp. A25]
SPVQRRLVPKYTSTNDGDSVFEPPPLYAHEVMLMNRDNDDLFAAEILASMAQNYLVPWQFARFPLVAGLEEPPYAYRADRAQSGKDNSGEIQGADFEYFWEWCKKAPESGTHDSMDDFVAKTACETSLVRRSAVK